MPPLPEADFKKPRSITSVYVEVQQQVMMDLFFILKKRYYKSISFVKRSNNAI